MYTNLETQIDSLIKTVSENMLQLKDFTSRSTAIEYLIRMLEKEKNIPEAK